MRKIEEVKIIEGRGKLAQGAGRRMQDARLRAQGAEQWLIMNIVS